MYVDEKQKEIFHLNNLERHNAKVWEEAIDTQFLDMTANGLRQLSEQLDGTNSAITIYKMLALIKAQEIALIAHKDITYRERRTWKRIAAIYQKIVELRLYHIEFAIMVYVNNEVFKLSVQNTDNVDYYQIKERAKLSQKLLRKSHKAKTVAESFAVYDEIHYFSHLFEQTDFMN